MHTRSPYTNIQLPTYLTVRRIGVDGQRQRRECRHCVGIGRHLSQRLCFVFICICMCSCVCAYIHTYISHTHIYKDTRTCNVNCRASGFGATKARAISAYEISSPFSAIIPVMSLYRSGGACVTSAVRAACMRWYPRGERRAVLMGVLCLCGIFCMLVDWWGGFVRICT